MRPGWATSRWHGAGHGHAASPLLSSSRRSREGPSPCRGAVHQGNGGWVGGGSALRRCRRTLQPQPFRAPLPRRRRAFRRSSFIYRVGRLPPRRSWYVC